MFINSSGGVEMNSIFKGSSEDIGISLVNLWDSFYKQLKA
jgi:TetR/AcrR family transcriptional regulator, transcriptional repressor for nem operon